MQYTLKRLIEKHVGKGPLVRPRRRWEDTIKTDLKENKTEGCEMDSSGSGQGPVLADSCGHGNEHSRSKKRRGIPWLDERL
jgi:hypothetical protein